MLYLRAGGDVFTLQMILGHEHLEMVRHYSRLLQSDIKKHIAEPARWSG
jgi:site-specific recombinase XerD